MTPALEGLLRESLWLALILSLPLVLASAITGFVVGLLQGAVSIQDAALTHLPRMVVVCLTLATLGPGLARIIVAFAERAFSM
jgi:flagellar biosynthetic protein FliQ